MTMFLEREARLRPLRQHLRFRLLFELVELLEEPKRLQHARLRHLFRLQLAAGDELEEGAVSGRIRGQRHGQGADPVVPGEGDERILVTKAVAWVVGMMEVFFVEQTRLRQLDAEDLVVRATFERREVKI